MQSDTAPLYYADYLELDKILSGQHPKSFSLTNPAHDEMLFVIVHQAYELWFKQIRFELDSVVELFKDKIDDNSSDMSVIVHRLNRITKIFDLIIRQVDVLETMTPLDFLEFRGLLSPASGFQSLQFRLIEAKLGLKMNTRHEPEYYKHTGGGGFTEVDLEAINQVEQEDSLKDSIIKWLVRMPFFRDEFWEGYNQQYQPPVESSLRFWADYRNIYNESISEGDAKKRMEFQNTFLTEGEGEFPAEAMRATLFIMLYRDLPIFRLPFELLTALIEIDELLSTWRYRHFMMVRRMIGSRVGTGGTSGAGYLEKTISLHYVFRELTAVNSFMIERSKLPTLPELLREKMGFSLGG